MLAKFDPVGHRDFWLRSFLDYVRTSDPERISPSARPHYAQLQGEQNDRCLSGRPRT
jgi:hypothetical protein